MKVTVDPDRCQGHAQCWDLCPEVFSLDEEGHALVTAEAVPAGLEAKASRAAANCPESAITVSIDGPAAQKAPLSSISLRCRLLTWACL